MTCPCLRQEYVGVCAASGFPHVPSVAQMETYCFKKSYRYCTYYRARQASVSESPTQATPELAGRALKDLRTKLPKQQVALAGRK
jgi:hypothetical protein